MNAFFSKVFRLFGPRKHPKAIKEKYKWQATVETCEPRTMLANDLKATDDIDALSDQVFQEQTQARNATVNSVVKTTTSVDGSRFTLVRGGLVLIDGVSVWSQTQDFDLGSDGSVYWLSTYGLLQHRSPSGVWIDIGEQVQKFAVHNSTIYSLDKEGILSVNGNSTWGGTRDFLIMDDGTIYWQATWGLLQRRFPNGTWEDLGNNITKIAELSGTVYWLDDHDTLYENAKPLWSDTKEFLRVQDGTFFRQSFSGDLWRRNAGGEWETIESNVYKFNVYEGVVFSLSRNGSLSLDGTATWSDVRDFVIGQDGTLHLLKNSGVLQEQLASGDSRTIGENVTKFAVQNQTVYSLDDGSMLSVNGNPIWGTTEDFTFAQDGSLYRLSNYGLLQHRLNDFTWTTIDQNVLKFEVHDGVVYSLTDGGSLNIDGIPTWGGTRDFLITNSGTLYWHASYGLLQRRFSNGSWQSIDTNVIKFVVHDDGRAYSLDTSGIVKVDGTEKWSNANDLSVDVAGQIIVSAKFNVTVPGRANPFLAGMPAGATSAGGDSAPAQSPVEVAGLPLQAGSELTFESSGSASNNSTPRTWGPNGSGMNRHTSSGGAENGIADLNAPTSSLVGVFLNDQRPDLGAAPESFDFAQIGLDYERLGPQLKQPFFIGDGKNHIVVVPSGATRLFLGTWDGGGWNNNVGEISVTVTERAVDGNLPVVGNKSGTVAEGASLTFTANHLSATDVDSSTATLIFTVKRVPGNGVIKKDGTALVVDETFTEADITDGKIRYVHDHSNTTSDSFDFTVQDPDGNETAETSFAITVTAVDDDAPTVGSSSVTLAEGATSTLTGDELSASDTEAAAASLTFTLTSVPVNGQLQKDGTALAVDGTFTQQDIADGKIRYVHDHSNTTSDSFDFTVQDPDGNETAESTFAITVTAVDDDVPVVTRMSGTVVKGDTLTLNATHLVATDPDSDDAALEYKVLSLPEKGELRRDGAVLPVNGMFTNADIAAGLVSYHHAGRSTTSDNFSFTVSDTVGNATQVNTFSLSVDPPAFEEVDRLKYALVSDQIMEFHGKNTFILDTNLVSETQISVSSADGDILSEEDIAIEAMGDGRLRVTLQHTSDEFGVTSLLFKHGQYVVSELIVLVLPTAGEGLDGLPEAVLDFENSVDPQGGFVTRKRISTELIPLLIANRYVSATEGLNMLRVSTPIEAMTLHMTEGAGHSISVKSVEGTSQAAPLLRQSGTALKTTSEPSGKYVEIEISTGRERSRPYPIYTSPGALPSDISPSPLLDHSAHFIWENKINIALGAVFGGFGAVATGLRGAAIASSTFAGAVGEAFSSGIRTVIDHAPFEGVYRVLGSQDPEVRAEQTKNWLNIALNLKDLFHGRARRTQQLDVIRKSPQRFNKAAVDTLSTATDLNDIGTGLSTLDRLGKASQPLPGESSGDFESRQQGEAMIRQALLKSVSEGGGEAFALSATYIELVDNGELPSSIGVPADLMGINAERLQGYIDSYTRDSATTDQRTDTVLGPPEAADSGGQAAANTRDAQGENGKDNEAFVRDGELVRAVYGAVRSVYDITQTVGAIADNIGQIFGSSGGSAGDYEDNDGRTYSLYADQSRQGTDDRDIINSGEGNDTVWGYQGDDRINTSKGRDNVDAGGGRNNVLTAGGDDRITDGNSDSFLSAGAGMDVIRPGGGNDFIEGGLGHDVIIYGDPNNTGELGSGFKLRTYDHRDIGNDILLDPTKSGEIHFKSHSFSELEFRKDRNDLEIILPSDTGWTSNTLKLQSYFQHDAAGWEVIDSFGNHYNLYEVSGRITSYESLEVAYRDRSATLHPDYPDDISHLTTLTDDTGRFTVHVASDDRMAVGRGLFLAVEGDNSITDWVSRNDFGSLDEANDLLAKVDSQFSFENYQTVTLVGTGEGGLIAQWFAGAAATQGPDFVNTQLINSPDISGLISQVVRESFPQYDAGFPNLANHYLVQPSDWVSKIGLWAGNDETYATWKAFSFDFDPDTDLPFLPELHDIESAHSPNIAVSDFDDLTIHDMNLPLVRGHVSLMSTDDFSQLFANREVTLDGKVCDSTTNAREVLFDQADEGTDDPVAESKNARDAYTAAIEADPRSPDDQAAPFSLKLDFQTDSQGTEHTAFGHFRVHEHTLFNPGAIEELTYGWEQITTGVTEGADRGRATSLERDFVNVSENTFIVELPEPGIYNVSLTLGDREQIRESMQVFVNGYAVDRISTMPGDFLTRGFQANTLDTELRITIVDRGGLSPSAAVNGIAVEQVNYRTALPISELLDNDPSIIVMAGSYELPESNGFIDTLEGTLKAAAMAAASALIPGIGAGLMSLSHFGTAFSAAITQGVTGATVGSVLSQAVGQAVVKSLVTSIPQNFISDPTARGILGGATAVFSGIQGTKAIDYAEDATRLTKAAGELGRVSSGLSAANGSLTVTNSIVQQASGGTGEPEVDLWMYDAAASLAQMSQQYRLGKIDAGFDPVNRDEVLQAISDGKSPAQILKLWQGSRDILVLDWVPEDTELTKVSVGMHTDLVNKSARALKHLVESYIVQLQEGDPEADLDLLVVSHGAAYDVGREFVTRMNTSDFADSLDYVKVVTLDPVSFNYKTGSWYHPELTSIVDRVDNVFQTEDTPAGSLEHIGRPLDGRIGGGSAGFYNRQARIFDLATTDEILRFRHWDTNEVSLSTAELTDIEFSPDGSLVAASGKDGIVTVRFVDDVPDPDSETGELLHAAGEVKFIVWGQESKVRSLAFMQMEVPTEDGQGTKWKDFLLTISAAHNPNNTDIDKNKLLLTDVETGLPVWQGRDIKGTQVEASPSGNVIVSTDANGHAKVWKRAGNTLTFQKHGDIVEAHPGQDGSYIADVYVINDEYFVTAGLNERMKLFHIGEDETVQVQVEVFDNPGQGKVRNLDYDPYNGVLAVASGQELSFWRFDQQEGRLAPLSPENRPPNQLFARQDHTKAIQGVSFSKPSFLLDEDGNYHGDRVLPGTSLTLPRTELGDIDLAQLPTFLASNSKPDSYAGLKLVTGGEDRTLFLYSLEKLEIGDVREESVLSGAMLPIREVTLSADGRRVAVVGEDNTDDGSGGPIKDIDVTKALDDRLGWKFSEIFLNGRREHNAVPLQWVYDVVEQTGESYFWLRNSGNANRPGDLDKSKNLSLPPNKRDNVAEIDVAPIDLYLRPGQQIEIKPKQYLLEVDREDYHVVQDATDLPLGDVTDADGNVVGSIRIKRVGGETRPNIFVFDASSQLDYTDDERHEFVGIFAFKMSGPTDLDGNPKVVDAEIKFRIINHKPVLYRDIVELHPNRSEIDYRPKANDYDFDNDDFPLYNFPTTKQSLTYGASNEVLATVKKNSDSTNGVDIVVTASEQRLTALLQEQASDTPDGQEPLGYLPLTFTYQTRETEFKAISTGEVEVRLQLQAGPENVRYTELGADQFVIRWEPVSWSATKYVIERYDANEGWVKHTENNGDNSDSKLVKHLQPSTEYWFRVVAVNENSGRRHASYVGEDRGGLNVTTPGYVPSRRVVAQALGAAQVEVRWEKVYWDAAKYDVKLYAPARDQDGTFVTDGSGSFVYTGEPIRDRTIDAGDAAVTVFKKLDPATAYLAVVVAKNGSNNVPPQEKVAEYPVITSERDLPSGIDLQRLGPKKLKVTWSTVSFAERYRIVAIDPDSPLSEATRIKQGFVAESGNANSGVLTGLVPETDYLIIVEARDQNDKWVSILSTESPPAVVANVPVATDDSQIDLSLSGATEYLLQTDFSQTLRLPSVDGLFVNTVFTVIALSEQPVSVEAASGENVALSSDTPGPTATMPPVIGQELEPGTGGIVIYRFFSTATGWIIELGDNTTEALYVKTPDYLAAEPGSFQQDPIDSKPRKPKIVWETPFWNVARHRVELYSPVLDSEGEPIRIDESTFEKGSKVLQNKTRLVSEPTSYTFKELAPDTYYIARLVTSGNGRDAVEEIAFRTKAQSSPTGVDVKDVSLNSFTATWTAIEWDAEKLRVNFVKLDAAGLPIESNRDERVASSDKTSKPVTGLESGAKYQFTVEAFSGLLNDWVPNTAENTKTVTTLTVTDVAPVAHIAEDSIGRRSFTVRWEHGDRANVDSFKVRVSPDNGTTWLNVENSNGTRGNGLAPTREQFEVTKIQNSSGSSNYEALDNGATYLVQVFAKYDDENLEVGLPEALEVTTKLRYEPEGVTATVAGPTSVTVAWDHDGSGVQEFRIRKLNQAGEWVLHKKNIGSDVNSITVNNDLSKLIPGESYKFSVVAVYAAETLESDATLEVTLIHATEARNVAVPEETLKRRQLVVTWLAPSPAWDVKDYRVELYRNGNTSSSWKHEVVGKNATSVTFTGLDVNTPYKVRVFARNLDLNSLSLPSDIVDTRTKDRLAPVGVTALVTGPTSARIGWTHDGDGIQEFNVQKKNQSGDWVVHTSDIGASVRSVDISNGPTKLIPTVSYEFRVVAVYAAGGEPSQSSGAVRMDDATGPKQVTVPDATLKRRQLTVTWETPSPAWDVADYRVELYRNGDTSSSWKHEVVGKNVTTANFKGLDVDTSYQVRVFARNLDLNSLSIGSNVLQIRTKPYVAPSTPTFSNVDHTQMTVKWSHSDSAGSADGFAIFRDGSNVGDVGNSGREFVDRGLEASTTYTYVIRAKYALDIIDGLSNSQQTLAIPAVPNVSVDQIYPSSARANWSQLTGATVTDYRIVVYPRGTTQIVAQKTVDKGTGNRSSTITGLPQATSLDLVVQALNGGTVVSTSAVQQLTTSSYVSPTFGPTVSAAFTNVRQARVIVNWSFSGDMEDIDVFKIVRSNGGDLGTTNPANFTGATSFSKEVSRTSNAQYNVFIRAVFKDGTIQESILLQMPRA